MHSLLVFSLLALGLQSHAGSLEDSVNQNLLSADPVLSQYVNSVEEMYEGNCTLQESLTLVYEVSRSISDSGTGFSTSFLCQFEQSQKDVRIHIDGDYYSEDKMLHTKIMWLEN